MTPFQTKFNKQDLNFVSTVTGWAAVSNDSKIKFLKIGQQEQIDCC